MTEKFDAIIIGTGQAGPSMAQRMTREGMKTAIIERKLFGGTCVNVGCIPTKALVASARAAHMARRGNDFGVSIDGSITVDMKQVKARKDAIVKQSNDGVTNWLKSMENLTVYEGHGRLESANAVSVNGERLEADKIVLNVGGRATVPDMPGINDVDYLTNTGMMDVDVLPEHLIIIGGSYIGRRDFIQGIGSLDPRLEAAGASEVKPGMRRPEAYAADVQAEFGQSFTLDASGSQAYEGRDIASYNWKLEDEGN